MSKIGFIGGGAMGEAIIKGLLGRGYTNQDIMVSDPSQDRLLYLKKTYGLNAVNNNKEVAKNSEVILLAVKPQNMSEAVTSIAGEITGRNLIITIMAGVPTAAVEKLLPNGAKVIRVMPNTPALVSAGTAAISGGSHVDESDLEVARRIFEAVGNATILPEKMLNAVTGLSGSSPAYVYMLIEALADGGVLAGLPRDVALKLAVDTVKGAAIMVEETKKHPGQLKDMVTSPAGTTIYGVLELEKAGFRGKIMEAVLAGAKRAEQLS